MNITKKIQENIFHYELFSQGAKIVVAVSGGPDSVCLLDVLYSLKEKYNLSLVVAHVNYGLRGKDSKLDEKFVKDLAKKNSLPIEVLQCDARKNSTSPSEEKLRDIRYSFFEKIRIKRKTDYIAVGHNLNDQAETVMLRILRGAGLRGLGAIKFKNEKIIRPLLNIPRKEILKYLKGNKLAYRIDKTNLGTDFTRNKIRNRLFPYLEKNYNPNIQEVLYKLSQSVSEDYAFINNFSQEWLKNNQTLQISRLEKLHPAIAREVLRLAIEKYNPGLREIESAHIDEIIKIIKSTKNKRQKIALKGLKIGRIGDKLIIEKLNS
ncbi:MAG: tRNA lysidine(34) synthetase TilS [Candidatus Moranbacteria bacterium]|nr:tRNA lysidine(34) synthetase TilS [Candidatus Moranbacteria bacterium]